jgi:predicted branched-subunit amino acid permease
MIMESAYIMTDTAAAGAACRPAAASGARHRSALERGELLAGARAVLPIAVAAATFGISFGILARDAGMGVVAPIVMSFTTFAGSAQFAAASVLEQGGALAAAILAAVLLNLRYLAIGISVAPSLQGSLPRRIAEAQLAGLALMVAWCGGTVAGVIGGGALGDPETYGLDAMFPALFLALLVGLLKDARAVRAAIAGALIALVLLPVAPPGVPVIAAVAGALLAGRSRPGRGGEPPAGPSSAAAPAERSTS